MMALLSCEKDNDRRLVTRCVYIEETCHYKKYIIKRFWLGESKPQMCCMVIINKLQKHLCINFIFIKKNLF